MEQVKYNPIKIFYSVFNCFFVACLMEFEGACFLDRSSNIVMVVIGYATIIPVILCLYAAWTDYLHENSEEHARLL